MHYLTVGYGNIGHKRVQALGDRCVATVDTVAIDANYRSIGAVHETYDAVILAVPNPPKYELMNYFLSRGKHVLVEKPLLLSKSQFRVLRTLARQNGVIWQTGYNHRFEPHIQTIKTLLPTLGDIYTARLVYGNGTVDNGHDLPVDQELGCHLLDLLNYLFGFHGQVKRVQSKSRATVADDAWLFARNCRFTMNVTYLSWKNTFTIDIYGARGSVHLDGLCKWGSSILVQRFRREVSGVPDSECAVVHEPDTSWGRELEAFEHAVTHSASSYRKDRWIAQCLR